MNVHVDPATLPARDPQRSAADPGACVFVTANAGSGKTKTLVDRVARLLLAGAAPAAILCVTYTKAAAAEMQRRLFETLGEWCVLGDAALSERLQRLDGRAAESVAPEQLREARRLFARALETPGGLKIQTIHAFCEKLLRRFPLEAAVSPAFQVLEDVAAGQLSAKAREDLALAALGDQDGPIGRAYARFAVELDPGRFDELLSALETRRADIADWLDRRERGRAKTPYQLCEVEDGVEPEDLEAQIVAGVDRELWRQAVAELGAGSTKDQQLAARLAAVDLDAGDFEALVGAFCTSAGEPAKSLGTKAVAPAVKSWLEAEQTRVCSGRERVRAARIARDTFHLLTLAQGYGALYEAAKRVRSGLDFADLVGRTRELLTVRADAAWVLYKLDGGVDHVLIDEAQDTAPEQWDVIRRLTDEFHSGATARRTDRTVFVVGDEKQSIYSFQGARPERLLAETQAYHRLFTDAGAEARFEQLEVSWRSTPEVLRFVDAVFRDDPVRARALSPERGDLPHHVPQRIGQAGSVELWSPPYKEPAKVERDAWDPVDAETEESARKRLARRIAAEIKDAVTRGDGVWEKRKPDEKPRKRPCGYGDWLILVRRRDALFEEIIRALKHAGVPVAGADRLRLSETAVFEDLLGLGRFALYPQDDLTLAALLRSPFCDVDEESLYDLAQGRDGGLWRALNARKDERSEWAAAARFFNQVRTEAETKPPFELFSRALGRQDAEGRSMRARFLTRMGREGEEALDEFLNQVLAAEARGARDLETCVAALERAEVEVKRELEGERGEVRIMTVHGAKGLEAPIVVLPDTTVKAKAQGVGLLRTEDGGFLWAPSSKADCPASAEARRLRDDKVDAESLRLLYVALTRARDRLVICGREPATRSPDAGSWWEVCKGAFAHPDLRDAVRELDGPEQTRVVRFGPDPEPVARAAAPATGQAALPAWAAVAPPAERTADWASPSAVADGAKSAAASPLAERGGMGRFRRGTLIHKLFEVLPELAPPDRAPAAERLLRRERDLTDDQRAEIAAAVFAVLEDARFAAVFGPGSRAEAAVAGTAPELGGVAVSGRLDRLVVAPDRVLVVDYKTNRPAPERAEDADPAYLAQTAVYVAVLRAVYPGRRVEAALLWTDGPKLTPLSDELVAETLARLSAR